MASEQALILSGVAEAGSSATQLFFLPSPAAAIDAVSTAFLTTIQKIPTLIRPLFGGSLAFEFSFELLVAVHALDIFSDPLSLSLCARKREVKSQERLSEISKQRERSRKQRGVEVGLAVFWWGRVALVVYTEEA